MDRDADAAAGRLVEPRTGSATAYRLERRARAGSPTASARAGRGRRLGREPIRALTLADQRLVGPRPGAALDPVRVLARGWSITRDEAGRVVRSIDEVAPGDRLVTTIADGDVRSTVDDG